MKCSKCGSDTLIKNGDWYECAECGAKLFDTDIKVNNITSPSKQVEEIEQQQGEAQNVVTYSPEETEAVQNSEEESDSKKKNKKNKKEEKPKSKLREAVDFCLPIVLAVIIAIFLKNCIFANAVVPTGSMLNTIQEGDRIIASRVAYINEDPERYDIVIFEFPDDESQYYVKRIIGLPGETVQIVNGIVYVTTTDGETIQLEDDFVTNCEPEGDFGPYVVPEDSYFMMGDNRNTSWDSRYWENKYVSKDQIIGKVMFKYYPGISKIE